MTAAKDRIRIMAGAGAGGVQANNVGSSKGGCSVEILLLFVVTVICAVLLTY